MSTQPKTIALAVMQGLMNDISNTHDLQLRLTKQIAFDEGRDAGYAEGYKAAQNNMQQAIFAVQHAAGITEKEQLA